MGYAELLKLKLKNTSTREKQAADIIIKSAERASDLTRQLLSFARGGKYNALPLIANDIIKEINMIQTKRRKLNIQEGILNKKISKLSM